MSNISTRLPLPTLQDLNGDPEQAFKNDQLKTLLNHPPPEKWMKINPYAGNSKYLPIDKVEFFLDRLFQDWKCEVISHNLIANSVCVHVRIHYRLPTTGEWMFHDGVGAKGLQVNSGAKPTEFDQIKGEAVMMALPMAKSYAIKDACDHIGKIFGRDANRKDTIEFVGAYEKPPEKEVPKTQLKEEERVMMLIEKAQSIQELEKCKSGCKSPASLSAYDKKYSQLKNK